MSRMPRASTGPELAVRAALHRMGLRFTTNRRDLPGSPDIVLSRARLAIFIDGCFWHGCAEHGVSPKSNGAWWRAKLAENRRRDLRKDQELASMGWSSLHYWEHEDPASVAASVAQEWRRRTGRSPSPEQASTDRRPRGGRLGRNVVSGLSEVPVDG